MIKKLTKSDQDAILSFAYDREEENLFITGTFERSKDPFAINTFYGYYDNETLLGLAVHFGEWNNINVSSQDENIVRTLTDHLVQEGHKIEDIACFRKYGDVIVDQLETKHGIKAKKVEDKTVFKLLETDFIDLSSGKEEVSNNADREELILFARRVFGGNIEDPITESELSRIYPEQQYVIRKDGKIVSTANLNGLSSGYFQIGGVGTLPEYRRQGLAKQVVSALCKTFLAQRKTGLLFTNNDNAASQKVYTDLGFKPVDEYIIAEY